MKKPNSRLSAILGFFLVTTLAVTAYSLISPQSLNFDLRRRASGDQIKVSLVNSSSKINAGQVFTIDIEVNTQGKFISGLQFVGEVSGVDLDKSALIVAQPTGLNPIFTQIKKDGDNLQFKFSELASLGKQAFTTHDKNIKVATLLLYPLKDKNIKVSFDQAQSGAMEFEKEFLSSSISQTSYNIEINDGRGGGSAPPDQGIHRSCNEYCSDSNECASEFSCYYNRCRNPKNLTGEQCADPIVITQPITKSTTVTTTATSKPKGGTTTSIKPFETEYVSLTSTPIEDDNEPESSPVVATVIITTASSSANSANKLSDSSSTKINTTPEILSQDATKSTIKVRNLGSSKIQASPQPIDNKLGSSQKKNTNLPMLIGAAIITGLIGIIAIIFFLKNINSK